MARSEQVSFLLATQVASYSELIGAIQARIAELGIRQIDFDKLAGWADGMAGKAFGAKPKLLLG